MPERTFNLYNKSGTKVASGKSPLQLLDLVEDTDYKKGDYTITAQEYSSESTPVDVPAFRTKVTLKLTIDGVETTGTYLTKDISQADYLALATKDANTLYRVQPTDSGSGRVHFLGDKIVDLTKDKDGNVVYSRNLAEGTQSWYTYVTFTGYNPTTGGDYLLEVGKKGIKESNPLCYSVDIDNSEPTNLYDCSAVVSLYATGMEPYYLQGNRIYPKKSGTSAGSKVISVGTTNAIVRKVQQSGRSGTCTVGYSKNKVWVNNLNNYVQYTVAPEDITSSANSGGGTFG